MRASFHYDHLIVAGRQHTNFYGIDGVRDHGLELKDLPIALAIRNHIITCFERAATAGDEATLRRLLTFVVVGGGPTGVEMAGAIAELIRHVLRKDFRRLPFDKVRVVLLEAADRLLPTFPQALGRRAQLRLERMGVEVQLKAVADYDGRELASRAAQAWKPAR